LVFLLLINAYWEREIVKGSRKIHEIQVHGHPLKLLVQDLACFYEYCLDEEWELCVNVAHIGWWRLETLQPLNVTSIQNFNVIDQVDVGQELDFGWGIFNSNARNK
jgi:hypothetical protein